jgi:hypothetical protein
MMGGELFSKIVFMFPNLGSRLPVYGKNPNAILIRRFLRSASSSLLKTGEVAITGVSSPFYQGAFDFVGAERSARVRLKSEHAFRLKDYPGYMRTMTKKNISAISSSDVLRTWVFEPL